VLVDFGGPSTHPHRTLRATKNRFGPAMELALFAMTDRGLEEITNPSAALLADRRGGAAGSAVGAVIEGTSPLLVEVQALVSRSTLATPRRVAQGVDGGRLVLLLAVLERRAGIRLSDLDVFVNVVGGVTVDEPALDLPVAAAVVSSTVERPLPEELAFFGEIGLLGEVRAVARAEERLREVATMGFARCALPASTALSTPPAVALLPLEDIGDLRRLLGGTEPAS